MKRTAGMHVGGPSILMVFVLLCLTTFAALALVSANADYRLAQKTASAVTAFYHADAQAETLLAEIDAALRQSAPGDQEAYRQAYEQALQTLTHPVEIAGGALRFFLPAGANRTLEVTLAVGYPGRTPAFTRAGWRMLPDRRPEDEEGDGLMLLDYRYKKTGA